MSPRALVRELIAALLHARGIARVRGCSSARESLEFAAQAPVLVCDASDMSAMEFAEYREAAQALRPGLHVTRLDEYSGAAALEAALDALRMHAPRRPLPHDSLTPIEVEVMLAVAAGSRNADIAIRMRRSAKTIEKHRGNALRKLGIRNVAQLTAYALRHGLLDGDSILAGRRE